MKERLQSVESKPLNNKIIHTLCTCLKKVSTTPRYPLTLGRREFGNLSRNHLNFHAHPGFNAHPGFSLLEVMAALTLTGLIITAVLSLFYNSYSVYRHSMERGRTENKAQVIYRRVSDIIGSCYSYPFHDGKIRCLQGDEYGFRLNTDREDGIEVEELTLVDHKLVYKRGDFREAEDKSEEVLATGIDGEFRYLHESTGTWRSEWSEDKYPALIRLDLRVKDENKTGNGEVTPSLVFPIMVELEYGRL